MKLDEVVGGPIYIDTNVLYMYLRVDPIYLPAVRKFFERVVHGNLEAFVGIPVMDELFYRLLLSRIKEVLGRNPLDVLREDLTKTIADHGPAIEEPLRKLAALPHLAEVRGRRSEVRKRHSPPAALETRRTQRRTYF